MTADKLKQYIALFGGLLSAVLLFMQSLGVEIEWFNDKSVASFMDVLVAAVPFIIVCYGVWKNTYIVTHKAKIHEEVLKKEGVK